MHTFRLRHTLLLCLLAVASLLGACESKTETENAASDEPPPLADLALPMTQRSGDAPAGSAIQVEATTEALRLDGKLLLTLDHGRVADADQKDGVVPALKAAMQSGARGALALRAAANLRYDTIALILHSAAQAGVRDVALQVRKHGQSSEMGWTTLRGYVTSSRAEELPTIAGVTHRSWEDFTGNWKAMVAGCQSARGASCGYADDNVAKGGSVRVELMTSGRGINLNFYRRGLTPEQEAEERKKIEQQLAQKKEDLAQGRITEDEFIEAASLGDASTYAMFQFRAEEAMQAPSALHKTIVPLCGGQPCALVVRAETDTPFMRIATALGAAFPDGTDLPRVAFELPWTKKAPPADLQAFIKSQQD